MTTIGARFARSNRTVAIIIALGISSMSAAAQPTLPAGTPVRVTLVGKQIVEGRLVSGDTSSITVRIDVDDIAIPRAQIATMSVRTATRGMRYGRRLGIATAAIGAWMLYGFVSGICESSSCRDAAPIYGAVGAGAGFVTGAAAGAIVGALYRDWESLPSSVAVSGHRGGRVEHRDVGSDTQRQAVNGAI